MDRRIFVGLLAGGFGALAERALAQGRAWDQVVPPTVADKGSAYYDFRSYLLPSADQKRRYFVQVGTPKRAAPAAGRPAIYMLDGNAAMASIEEGDLAELDKLSPPVIVAIGHDTRARNDVIARAYDYTPPVRRDGAAIDPIVRGRPGGGADVFADLIEAAIKPEIESKTPLDKSRQTLWGHSYGGLFTLHVVATRPDLYQRYAAGDPSMWWHDGVLVEELDRLDPARLKGRTVRIMSGGGRAARTATPTPARPPQPAVAAPDKPADTTRNVPARPGSAGDFAKRMRQAGADVTYQEFDGLNHGQMLPASLKPALRLAAS